MANEIRDLPRPHIGRMSSNELEGLLTALASHTPAFWRARPLVDFAWAVMETLEDSSWYQTRAREQVSNPLAFERFLFLFSSYD